MNPHWLLLDTWLVRSAVGGGLLLFLAWGTMCVLRQPARRQRLGEWAAAAGILLAALSLLPSWLTIAYSVPAVASPAPAAEPVADREGTLPAEIVDSNTLLALLSDPSLEESNAESALPDTKPAANSLTLAVATSPAWLLSWETLLLCLQLLYACGVVWFLGRWLLGCVALARLLRSAQPAPQAAARVFAEMAERMWPRPRLLVSPRLHLPISFGIARPTVILPSGWCQNKDTASLRWVFTHELTHLQRRDAWSCWLFAVAQLFYFYLPWFWSLRRHVRLCQEYVADAMAAAEANQPVDYAEFLLRLTPAPAVAPVSAVGVFDNSSDLFRRVTMLLQSPVRPEKDCPTIWSVLIATALGFFAVLVAGFGVRAEAVSVGATPDPVALAAPPPEAAVPAKEEAAQEEPKKEEPAKDERKKEEPKREPNPLGVDIDQIIKQALESLPPGQEFDKVREQLKKQMEQLKNLQQQVPGLPPNAGQDVQRRVEELRRRIQDRGLGGRGDGRLGASVTEPDEVLVEQLNLAKGQGVVVGQVKPDSPAAKAGIQPKDILLELDGKAVPSNVRDFAKLVQELKANTPVDAVVLRKGKKETIKDISLPETRDANPLLPLRNFPPNFPFNPGAAQGRIQLQLGGAPGQAVATARTGDQFTSTHKDGDKTITITGTVSGDKSKVTEIAIQDGEKTSKYDDLSKVPEALRDKVKYVIDSTEKTNRSIDAKKNNAARAREQ